MQTQFGTIGKARTARQDDIEAEALVLAWKHGRTIAAMTRRAKQRLAQEAGRQAERDRLATLTAHSVGYTQPSASGGHLDALRSLGKMGKMGRVIAAGIESHETQAIIAKQLGVSQPTLSRLLAELRADCE